MVSTQLAFVLVSVGFLLAALRAYRFVLVCKELEEEQRQRELGSGTTGLWFCHLLLQGEAKEKPAIILGDEAMYSYRKRQIVLDRKLANCPVPLSLLEAAHEVAHHLQHRAGWLVPVRLSGYALTFVAPFLSAAMAFWGMRWWAVFSLMSAIGVGLAAFPEVDAWKRAALAVEDVVKDQDAWAADWTKKYVRAASLGKFAFPLAMCTAAHIVGFLAVAVLFSLFSVSPPSILNKTVFAPVLTLFVGVPGYFLLGAYGICFSHFVDLPRLVRSPCRVPPLRTLGWGVNLGGLALGWAVLAFVLAAAALAIVF